MLNQKCIVHNKTQLLVAIKCSYNFYGITKIILNKKDGTSAYYKIQPRPRYQKAVQLGNLSCWKEFKAEFHKGVRNVIRNIKRTPAECFR